MDTPVLAVRHVSKSFAGVRALVDIDLDIAPGEVLLNRALEVVDVTRDGAALDEAGLLRAQDERPTGSAAPDDALLSVRCDGDLLRPENAACGGQGGSPR